MPSGFAALVMILSMISERVQNTDQNHTLHTLNLSSYVSAKPTLTSVVLRNTSTTSEENATTGLTTEFVNSVLGADRYTYFEERKEKENRNKTILFSIAGTFAGILLLCLIKCLLLPWCRRNCCETGYRTDIYIQFTTRKEGRVFPSKICNIKVGEFWLGHDPALDIDVKYGENKLRPKFVTCYDFPFSCMPRLKIKYNDNEVFSKSRSTSLWLKPIIKLSFMKLLEMRSILNSSTYKYIFYARKGDASEYYNHPKYPQTNSNWPFREVEVQNNRTVRYTALRRSVMATEHTQTDALNNSRDYDSSDTSSDDDGVTVAGTGSNVCRNGSKNPSTGGASVNVPSSRFCKTTQTGANSYMECNGPNKTRRNGANSYTPSNFCNRGTRTKPDMRSGTEIEKASDFLVELSSDSD